MTRGNREFEMGNEIYELKRRRYDLDWLRVLAFGILILYHTGMYYVADWGWHIKSMETSETLQLFMMLVNPWRMPLLFLISGAALWFAGRKMRSLSLLGLRVTRLLPPLVLGMLVIVPPQLYFQLVQQDGASFSYLEFYRIYLDIGTELYPEQQYSPLGLLTWNHLWFIPYLLSYTMAFVLLKPILDVLAGWLSRLKPGLPGLYLAPASLLVIYGICLRPYFPETHALVGDWYNHAIYFTAFIFGYLMAGQMQITRSLVSARWVCLSISLVTYTVFILLVRETIEFNRDTLFSRLVIEAIIYLNGWGWILTVLAWSATYLNRPSRALSYMNTAILPWYVLHQTLTVIAAWYLSSIGLPIGLEALLVVLATIAGCTAGYEIVRRFTLTRFLFGLKLNRAIQQEPSKQGPVLQALPEN
jgi:glucan biosynthesis protein C